MPVKQLVRFVIEQYRDELITSLRGSLDEEKKNEDREVVVRDLLNILHSIPIQSIATNGPSLVCPYHKYYTIHHVLNPLRSTRCALWHQPFWTPSENQKPLLLPPPGPMVTSVRSTSLWPCQCR